MDGYAAQLQAEAAESEGILPQLSEPSTPHNEEEQNGTTSTSRHQTDTIDSLPSLGSVFSFAASWGKKLQADLQLDQFVDQVKKQSEEVTKAYTQDIAEFAQAVKTGATRGMDELSTRFAQIKTDFETEFNNDEQSGQKSSSTESEQSTRNVADALNDNTTPKQSQEGLLGGLGKHFQVDALRQQQERAKRLMSKLGGDLEDLLRDAIVIEAPGSAGTEEQKTAARKIIYDRRMAQLAAIQESETTYLADPSTRPEYTEFIKGFALDNEKNKQIDELLKEHAGIKDMMEKLVPKNVSREEFWTRYFFHAWLVDQEETRRKKLVEAAVAATAEDEFSWDAEDDEKEREEKEIRSDTPESRDADGAQSSAAPVDTAKHNAAAPETQKEAAEPSSKREGEGKKKSSSSNNTGDDDGWDEWE
ncbi:hypothetical protein FB645_000659 [Coemansia sp. IMI 203386]|nr:hypothetical protein FB645_000659 [Coemansia sp. IMI 203386]